MTGDELRAFREQQPFALPQLAVLFAERGEQAQQLFDARFEPAELRFDAIDTAGFLHARHYNLGTVKNSIP